MADNCECQSVELDEVVNIWHKLVRSMEGDMSWDSLPIWGGFLGELEWQMTLNYCEGQSLDTLSLVTRISTKSYYSTGKL